jgi:hypothetical protein
MREQLFLNDTEYEELPEEARQYIRNLFPSIAFPAPEFRQIYIADKEKPEERFVALTDGKTNHTYNIVSHPYNIVRHENVIFHAIAACNSLRRSFGKEKIAIQLLDNGARMSFEIIWLESAKHVRMHNDNNIQDAICPLFHGVNTFDRFIHFTSEYGLLRLDCENVMIAGHVPLKSNDVHDHIRIAREKFNESYLLFSKLADGCLTRDKYLELWKIGTGFGLNKTDKERIEIVKIIGYNEARLRSIVKRCKADFTVPSWMVYCAITQFGTHILKGKQRQIQFNTIASKLAQHMITDGFLSH